MATNNSVNTSLAGQTGTGKFVGDTSPTLVTPALGTPSSGTLTNCTGLPLTTGVTGVLPSADGGTGVNNGSSTVTLGGSLTTSGAFTSTFTMTGNTSVTFPTSGTLATTAQIPSVTPAALTEVDDTNVTMTLGGTPSTALLQAVSMTLGWTGTLAVTRGGTGVATVPTNGQIPIGNGTNYTVANISAGTGISVTNGSGSITIANTAPSPTPAALTEVDDTNVTMTLGGSPSTALLQAVSMTLGWTGTLAVTRGGTGNSVIGSNGTIAQSDGTKYTFTTATYPSTTTANQLLYSSATNTVGGLSSANSATLVTNNSGVPAFTASMTNGQILIGSTGATPTLATLTAGSNITITNGAGAITIASTGGGGGGGADPAYTLMLMGG